MKFKEALTLLTAAIVVIAFLFLVFLTFKSDSNLQNPIGPYPSERIESFELLPVEDESKIKLADKEIVIPDDFYISTIFVLKENERFLCSKINEGPCRIYFITNKEDLVTTYYLSTSGEIELASRPGDNRQQSTLQINGKSFEFTVDKVSIANEPVDNESAEADSKEAQIFGCLNQSICINSNFLDVLSENHEENLNKFLSFASNLATLN